MITLKDVEGAVMVSWRHPGAFVVVLRNTMKKLCGDGFVDFIHRPKSKILKILKN
jgi:hypothetical protein